MSVSIQELYPRPGLARPLQGTYLEQRVHELGSPAEPFVYANFVSSLDGRIAVAEAPAAEPYVLDDLTSGHDWRLFQELQGQADCLVTHGAYLRALAAGRFGNILQVGVAEPAQDIGRWRQAQGLAPQPAVAVVSRTLDFPLPAALAAHRQPVHIVTGAAAAPDKVHAWRERGCEVLFAGRGHEVDGAELVRLLGERGYARLYLLAGPQLLHTVLRRRALSRLYVTVTHQLVGGEHFHTMLSAPRLGASGRLKLHTLYYDPHAPAGTGQWFAAFDVRRGADG
jgi:riboflavin biosynthesis pyrimidine reductase